MRYRLLTIALIGFAILMPMGCSNSGADSATHSVTFTVTATNGVTQAETIDYMDTSLTVHSLTAVPLPWSVTVSMPVTTEQNTVKLSAAAISPAAPGSVLTGTIQDNGFQVKALSDAKSDEGYMSVSFETLI